MVLGLIVGDVAKDSSVMKAVLPLPAYYSPSSSPFSRWFSSLAALPLIPFAMKLPCHLDSTGDHEYLGAGKGLESQLPAGNLLALRDCGSNRRLCRD